MLQLAAIAVLGLLAYLFFRNTQRQMSRVRNHREKASEPVETLERDPKTGVYRPSDRDIDSDRDRDRDA